MRVRVRVRVRVRTALALLYSKDCCVPATQSYYSSYSRCSKQFVVDSATGKHCVTEYIINMHMDMYMYILRGHAYCIGRLAILVVQRLVVANFAKCIA